MEYLIRDLPVRLNHIKDRNYELLIYGQCQYKCSYCVYQFKDFDSITIKKDFKEKLFKIFRTFITPITINIGNLKSDPYQEAESKYFLTRKTLEIIKDFKFKVNIFTKSKLILRDIELLKELNANVVISFVSLNRTISKILEPEVISPRERLKLIKELSSNNINTGVHLTVLPFITTKEVDKMIEKFLEVKIKFILDTPLILNTKDKEVFLNFIKNNDKLNKYLRRYSKMYEKREYPSGKVIKEFNRSMFEFSLKHGIRRSL